MDQKKCCRCKIVKPISNFSPKKRGKSNFQYECKACRIEQALVYKRTKDGLITQIYSSQKRHSKKRGHDLPSYTKQELKDWCFSQKLFHELYDDWKASGFKKAKIPSCDRKNDYDGYSLNGIQLMTWEENRIKGNEDARNGINNKHNKAVVGIHRTTGKVVEFYSQREAARRIGISQSNITQCCLGNKRHKYAGGFIWRYKETVDGKN